MTLATNRGLMSVRPVEACSTGAGGCVLPDTSNDIEGAPPSTIRPRICAQSDGTLWQFMLVRQLMASEGAPASAGQRLGLRSSAANGGSSDGAANAESSSAAAFVAAALTSSTPAPALSERLRQQTPEASEAASWLASAPGAGAPPAILAAALLGGGAGHGASDATARLAAALVAREGPSRG
ncbi:unnamed protein product, partial [Prorocentrum cordatum]